MSILIIDPFSSGSLYADLLQGTDVIVYYLQTTASVISGIAEKKNKDYLQFNEDFNTDIEKLSEWAIKNEVNTVLTGSESAVPLAEQLKEILRREASNTKHNIKDIDVRHFYDKACILTQLSTQGIETGKFLRITAEDEEDLESLSTIFAPGEKLVVKPCRSAGSADVTIANDLQDALNKATHITSSSNFFGRKKNDALIQEFHAGIEFVVDTVSYQGNHQIIAVSQYDKHPSQDGYFIYDRIRWLEENDHQRATVSEYSYQILNALGFYEGSAHIEIILVNETPYLIDIGFRPHGAGHPMRTFELSGTSQIHEEIAHALQREGVSIQHTSIETAHDKQRRSGCIEFFSLDAPAITGSTIDFSSITELESVHDFQSHIQPNSEYPATRTLSDSVELGLCFILSDSPTTVRQTAQEARRRFARFFR